MRRSTIRLVIGFLIGFVAVSIAPMAPSLFREAIRRWGPNVSIDPLMIALALGAVLLVTTSVRGIRWWIGRWATRVPAFRHRGGVRAVVHRAAESGEQVPAIARRTRLSQDAVRGVLGREGQSGSERGTSFRHRQPSPREAPSPGSRVSAASRYGVHR